VLLFIFCAFVFFVFMSPTYREAEIAAIRSDAALILATLKREHPAVSVENRWKVFDEAERERILASIGFGVEKDKWGNQFQIAARRLENGTVEFIVWSPGPDGVSGNAADIVVPEERSHDLMSILGVKRGNN
jgi:hypothetical protein